MPHHRIRLRGPWEVAESGAAEGTLSWRRAQMPASWEALVGVGFRGRLRLRRVFHQPTGLSGGDRVWLVVETVSPVARVTVNASLVAGGMASGMWEADITELLHSDNRLEIELDPPVTEADASPAATTLVFDEVALEMRLP
jgi:hypothetical protein